MDFSCSCQCHIGGLSHSISNNFWLIRLESWQALCHQDPWLRNYEKVSWRTNSLRTKKTFSLLTCVVIFTNLEWMLLISQCSSSCVGTGTCRLLLVHIMTLKVLTSTRLPCPSLKMWQLGKESRFLQIHRSQRPGEYKTQVCSMSLHSHV